MSFKVGFIDGVSHSNVKSFDFFQGSAITDDPGVSVIENSSGSSFISRNSNTAKINLNMDFYTQATVSSIRGVLNNRKYPAKLYLHHPADASQVMNFAGITNPSSTHEIKKGSSDSPSIDFGIFSEVATGDYTNVSEINTDTMSQSTGANKYSYLFFKFDLTDFKTLFGANYAEYIQRLTLFTHNAYCSVNGERAGFKCSVFDANASEWVEIKRINYTSSDTDLRADSLFSQQYYPLRPVEGFSRMVDFIDSDSVIFRLVNFQDRVSDTAEIGVNFVECFINGFGVSPVSPDNFTWRSPFIGQGYQDTLELIEL